MSIQMAYLSDLKATGGSFSWGKIVFLDTQEEKQIRIKARMVLKNGFFFIRGYLFLSYGIIFIGNKKFKHPDFYFPAFKGQQPFWLEFKLL